VGTGASGVQAIPVIAEQADHLTVFQRTPVYAIPARNAPMDLDYERRVKARYGELRQMQRESFGAFIMLNGEPTQLNPKSALEVSSEEREAEYDRRWRNGGLQMYFAFSDLLFNKAANDTAAEYLRKKIRERVRDPEIAERLTPRDYCLGTRRICADNGYYETYNRANVTLVDLKKTPIEAATPRGLRVDGVEHPLDILVMATGFDAVTGALIRIDVRGRNDLSLKDKWAENPRSLLGLMTAGFPNLFTIGGPGSTSSLTQSVASIEFHTQWIVDAMMFMRGHGHDSIEPTTEAENAWFDHVNATAAQTLFPTTDSWYMGANVEGKPRAILGYLSTFAEYRSRCNAIAANGYDGFVFDRERATV
jgi:cation diffusion facilitator CzcD-associated flavoprotein CzcO